MNNRITVGVLFFALLSLSMQMNASPVVRSYQQHLEAGWNIVSLGIYSGDSPETIYGSGVLEVRRWDPASGEYVVPSTLQPGEGCEVKMAVEADVIPTGSPVTSPYAIQLEKGWNEIGNPFSVDIPWSRIRVDRNGKTKNLKQARKAGWIGSARTMRGGSLKKVRYGQGILAVGEGCRLKAKKHGLTLTFDAEKIWTVLCYLDGDNTDMNTDFSHAFDHFAEDGIGSDDRINIVAQFDRIPGNPSFGGWSIAHRFFVTPGMVPTEDVAIQNWGDGSGGREVDMADPDTLRDFIKWSTKHYPAKRYLLLLGDHGFGWQGLCVDDTSLGDFMLLNDLRDVLLDSPVHFDILALDLCNMHTGEVLYAIEDAPVDISVGSETPGRAWPLWDVFHTIMDDPDIASDDYACNMADLYVDYNEGLGNEDVTLSAVRLGEFSAVTPVLHLVSEAALSKDSWDQVTDLTQTALIALGDSVICEKHGSDYPDTHGVTVYFPPFEGPHGGSIPAVYSCCYLGERTSFADDALWRNLLYCYYWRTDNIDRRILFARDGLQVIDDSYVDLRALLQGIL